MAVGAAVAGVGLGLAGLGESRKARKASQAATTLSIEQQKETTAEEIRRQEYTHKRDISSIEAEIAASGLSSTEDGLRGGKRTITSIDPVISTMESEIADIDAKVNAYEFTYSDGGKTLIKLAIDRGNKLKELESLKEQQTGELDAPWNPEGGIFSEYLIESERVHLSEISWMRKTGLSTVASIAATGESARLAARQAEISSYAQITQSAANWWQAVQPPATTTTTQQTATV